MDEELEPVDGGRPKLEVHLVETARIRLGVPQQSPSEGRHTEQALALGIEMHEGGLLLVHERVALLVHLARLLLLEAVRRVDLDPHAGGDTGGESDEHLCRLHLPAPLALLLRRLLEPVVHVSDSDVLGLEVEAALDLEGLLVEGRTDR